MKYFLLILCIFISGHYCNDIIDASSEATKHRSFGINYENNTFVMNGKPFRYISGSFHYFRALPETWATKLRAMRAAGLNAVSTYVEWSIHNPKENLYKWDGIANLVKFIRLAEAEDLFVILRPGPYICAERDMGGFPYWLLTKYPGIQLRTYDTDYLNEVRKWYSHLMPRIEPYLYGNGGPIILVQVENEYGSFIACDLEYRQWLANETTQYVQEKAVLFTTDGPDMLRCGKVDGVYTTIDFGPSRQTQKYWEKLRRFEPTGPLVNSEFYPGWLTHWQENMQRVQTSHVIETFRQMLLDGANVNFYMFFGGTNFGFTAGANDGGPGRFNADVTSYDYDAPLDEAGDPTPKYMAIRDVIAQFHPLPNISVPEKAPKMKLGSVELRPISLILSDSNRNLLGATPVNSRLPLTFEELNQNSGFVLYETAIPRVNRDPSLLTVNKLRDRAIILVDQEFVGILSRENNIYSLPLSTGLGKTLQIFVENQGRINYNIANDFKGILGSVTLNGNELFNWTMTGYPFEKYTKIEEIIEENETVRYHKNFLKAGPMLFHGEFNISEEHIWDTYLNPAGWGKGVVFINGFNLGRYWPLSGPQITLYVPKEILKHGLNKITMLELQKASKEKTVEFTDKPNLDGI